MCSVFIVFLFFLLWFSLCRLYCYCLLVVCLEENKLVHSSRSLRGEHAHYAKTTTIGTVLGYYYYYYYYKLTEIWYSVCRMC